MWLQQTPQPEFSRLSILRYRDALLHRKHLAPKSINLQLTALRKLAKEALDEGIGSTDGLGETFDQLTTRLVKLGGPKGLVALRGSLGDPGVVAEHIGEGLFKRYRFWAERVVRTECAEAYSVHALNSLVEANEEDPGYEKRWDAALVRDRTCPVCKGLDGTAVALDAEFPGGYKHPPAHPLCLCTLTPWRPEWGGKAAPPKQAPDAAPPPPPKPAPPREASARRRRRAESMIDKLQDLLDQVDPEASVFSVPRNDVAAALAFYERRGSITGHEARVLLQLQDDPAELLNLMATWEVVDSPKE